MLSKDLYLEIQRNRLVTCRVFFVAHYPDKCFYNELVTAAFYIKKREKFFN